MPGVSGCLIYSDLTGVISVVINLESINRFRNPVNVGG